jgi:hypothetical protein
VNPHEIFGDLIRCSLVNPRRNTRRALAALKAGELKEAKRYLEDIQSQIAHAEALVAAENDRRTHTCRCGHVHYIQRNDQSGGTT